MGPAQRDHSRLALEHAMVVGAHEIAGGGNYAKDEDDAACAQQESLR
jgi:hypothetical protein